MSFARCHFRTQKSPDFQGPPLPMALVMDLPHQGGKEQYEVYLLPSANPPALMGANPLQGPSERVGPENRDNLEIKSDM
jgi:hypothetical protein